MGWESSAVGLQLGKAIISTTMRDSDIMCAKACIRVLHIVLCTGIP